MNIVRSFVALFLALVLVRSITFAGSTGKISGKVTDAATKESLPGVNVLVEGTTLGGTTNIEGQYVILNVPPGRHTIIASFIGYSRMRVTDVRVSVDFTTPLDFALEQGNIEVDAIVVQGERTPLIRQDLTNPVASISSETISELPVTELSEVIGLQAGITVDDDGSIHIRGGYGNEISYTLNGISINNPYGNSRSVGLATNAIEEVSVSSGTFNAEYGSSLSGVVNYITKDGGSKWTGSLKYYTGDHASSRKDPFFNIDDFNPVNVNRVEASLGGPLLADELSFFASGVYNYNGGYLYGQQLYMPNDSYLSREGFPSNDPRRGASTDPLYFGPLRNSTTDALGAPSGDGSIVPLNWSRSYNLQGNMSYRITPVMKVKYEAVISNDLSPASSGTPYRFRPDGRALDKADALFQSLEWTHTLNDRMFYTLKGSYTIENEKVRTYDDINDPRYLPSFYQQLLPGTAFLTGGTDLFRFSLKYKSLAGKFDLVAQLFNNHEVKFGLEARTHDLDVEAYSLFFRDPNNPGANPSFLEALRDTNVHFVAYVPNETQGYVRLKRKPLQLAGYLQDKIELFHSIILNLGIRYEMFDPAAKYNPQISDEYFVIDSTGFYKKNVVDASIKHMVSPRFSVSFPITDQGTIRFSYGHFYQMGSLSSLYSNPNFNAPLGTTPFFGNADVNPQKSVQYELGLQQGLTDNLKVEVTGYYKDVSDYIYSQFIQTARGDKPFYLLTNLSYANTRGISISLLKRRGAVDDLLTATIDYTFQIADGNRTEPADEVFFSEQRGRLSESYLVPFSFDRSHTITSTVALGKPSDWSVSAISYIRTGTPYTPSFPSNVVPISFTQNSDRQPTQWNVDLKLVKFFEFGPFTYSVFLQVDNLFDTPNEINVFSSSGRALYSVATTLDATRFSDLRRRVDRGDVGLIPSTVLDTYDANPRNLSAPRLVRIGASIQF